MRQVRYQRGSLASTLAAAIDLSHDSPRYVFATALGFTVWPSPPLAQSYYKVHAGSVEHVSFAPWEAT